MRNGQGGRGELQQQLQQIDDWRPSASTTVRRAKIVELLLIRYKRDPIGAGCGANRKRSRTAIVH